MTIIPFDGPPELFILDDSILPNLRSGSVGPEVSGFYYVFGEASSTSFEIVGGGKSVKIDNLKPGRGLTPDLLAKQFKEIHQARARVALSQSPMKLTRSGGSHPPGPEKERIRMKR